MTPLLAALAAALAYSMGCQSDPRLDRSNTTASVPTVVDLDARLDTTLEARVTAIRPMRFAREGSSTRDYPPFLRAASAIRRWGQRHLVVQDDVNVVGVSTADAPDVFQPLLLPPGQDGRRRFENALGNIDRKMDLESAAVLPDGRVVAFGSGSTSAREQIVIISRPDTVKVLDARELYGHLRRETSFAGSELNVEGALVAAGMLKLFQRGNGAPGLGLSPVNAVGDIPLERFLRWLDDDGPAPLLTHVARVTLGRLGSANLGFTDAALQRDGTIALLACAEDSPDAIHDGEVLGCRFGLLEPNGVRLMEIIGVDERPSPLKLEGIESGDDPGSFDVVADMDDPDSPALRGQLKVMQRAETASR